MLHVEVGGGWGGSTRALELYLRYNRSTRFTHDLLFYYPTPGAERLRHLVRSLFFLYEAAPHPAAPGSSAQKVRRALSRYARIACPPLAALREWLTLAAQLPTACRIRRFLAQHSYDLVHVNNTFTYQIPTLIAARMARIPVVAHVRSQVPLTPLSAKLALWANRLVTVSQELEEQLRDLAPLATAQTCHDGVEMRAPDSRTVSAFRASLVPLNGILIGSVGRLSPEKGYDVLIRAARLVVDVRPNVKFAVAGEGPLRSSLERLIVELRLTTSFRLCGFQADVASFLAAIDLFVCSSHREGLPLAIIEAMLMGKAVMATDVGGNRGVVIPGRTGALTPPGNPSTMASAILSALDQKESFAGRAEEIRRTAAMLTDPGSCALAFEDALEGAFTRKEEGSCRPQPYLSGLLAAMERLRDRG